MLIAEYDDKERWEVIGQEKFNEGYEAGKKENMEQVKEAIKEKEEADVKAKEADERAKEADVKAKEADERAKEADVKAKEADERAKEADVKAKEAEKNMLCANINTVIALYKMGADREFIKASINDIGELEDIICLIEDNKDITPCEVYEKVFLNKQ